jgi:hypothetical protein
MKRLGFAAVALAVALAALVLGAFVATAIAAENSAPQKQAPEKPHSSALLTGVALEVFFPPTDPRHPDYNDVQRYLLSKSSPAFPLISGAVIRVDWSDFDLGDAAAGTHTRYDFRLVDEMIAPWLAAGKTANLVLHSVPYGAPPNCPRQGSGSNGESGTGNCAMPAWMWTALGSANYVTCDRAQAPNFFSSAFQTNYQAAIAALVKHYAGNAGVGYIRVGLGKGGEINLPRGWQNPSEACGEAYSKRWGYTIGDSDAYTWNAYLKKMLEFEGTLASSKQLMTSLTPVQAPGHRPEEVSDFIAPIAAKNGIGLGNQGLSEQSMRNCSGVQVNWCAWFERYQAKIPLESQTLGRSCPQGVNQCDDLSRERALNRSNASGEGIGPSQRRWPGSGQGESSQGGSGQGGLGQNRLNQNRLGQNGQRGQVSPGRLSSMTGPLPPLLPFAIKNHATILEIYCEDWLIAFSPDHPDNARYGAEYAQALKQAAKGQ